MGKVGIKQVRVERFEGVVEECFAVRGSLELAEAQLRTWARTAPNDGTYDKTGFVVTFEDGYEYTGRIDLERKNIHGYSIKQHMREYQEFLAGMRQPAHMTKAQYLSYLSCLSSEIQFNAREFLSKYDV